MSKGGGDHLRSTSKTGGPGEGPMLKSLGLHSGPKGGLVPPCFAHDMAKASRLQDTSRDMYI